MSLPHIRPVVQEDLNDLVELCSLHAAYERSEYQAKGKQKILEKYLFSDPPALYSLVVEHDGNLVGYSTYTRQFSTWDASYYLYMDCLYLKENYRGRGIGLELMNKIKDAAAQLQCSHIQWQTPDFNVRAIKFYQRIGGVSKSKERFFWYD